MTKRTHSTCLFCGHGLYRLPSTSLPPACETCIGQMVRSRATATFTAAYARALWQMLIDFNGKVGVLGRDEYGHYVSVDGRIIRSPSQIPGRWTRHKKDDGKGMIDATG